MELDFAIQHCKEVASRIRAEDSCSLCADEHEQLARFMETLQAYRALGSLDHLRELVQAKKDGRLVVLPFAPKKTVWVNAPYTPRPYKCFYADALGILMDSDRGCTFWETYEEAENALEGKNHGAE